MHDGLTYEGRDSANVVTVTVDEVGRPTHVWIRKDWVARVDEEAFGRHVIEALDRAIEARDRAALDEGEIDVLQAKLRALRELPADQLRELAHASGVGMPPRSRWEAVAAANERSGTLDLERFGAFLQQQRALLSRSDEITGPGAMLVVRGTAGRPSEVRVARGWSTRTPAMRQASQVLDALHGLVDRHRARVAALESDFPTLVELGVQAERQGLALLSQIPTPENTEARRD